jgi:hypothetical protein
VHDRGRALDRGDDFEHGLPGDADQLIALPDLAHRVANPLLDIGPGQDGLAILHHLFGRGNRQPGAHSRSFISICQ